LTGARTAEVFDAKCEEIDLTGKIWTVPEDRMKGGRDIVNRYLTQQWQQWSTCASEERTAFCVLAIRASDCPIWPS